MLGLAGTKSFGHILGAERKHSKLEIGPPTESLARLASRGISRTSRGISRTSHGISRKSLDSFGDDLRLSLDFFAMISTVESQDRS